MTPYNVHESPFLELRTPFTTWEAIKMLLLLPLVPIRVAVIFISLCTIATMNTIALLGWPHTQPLPIWRRRIVEASGYPARVMILALGLNVQVQGWENVKKAYELGAIGVFNHVAYFDALVLFTLLLASGVAKESTEHIPLAGRCIRPLQMVYVPETRRIKQKDAAAAGPSGGAGSPKGVDSSGNSSPSAGSGSTSSGDTTSQSTASPTAKPVANGAARDATITGILVERLNHPLYCKPGGYPLLVMAPEGTVTNGRVLLPFKSGGFVAGRPVMPILLDYTGNKRHNVAWVETGIPFHMLRCLCQFVNHLKVSFLEPHVPTAEEKANPALFAENIRRLMAKELKVGLSDDTFLNMKKMQRLKIKVEWHGHSLADPYHLISSEGIVDLDAALPEATLGAAKKTQ